MLYRAKQKAGISKKPYFFLAMANFVSHSPYFVKEVRAVALAPPQKLALTSLGQEAREKKRFILARAEK